MGNLKNISEVDLIIASELHDFMFKDQKLIYSPLTLSVLSKHPLDDFVFSATRKLTSVSNLAKKGDVLGFSSKHLSNRIALLIQEGFLVKGTSATHAQLPSVQGNCLTCMVNVSQVCNLRCDYCYVDFGKFDFKDKTFPPIMGIKLAEQIPSFLIKNFPDLTTYAFHFYGGEPLSNFPVIKKIVEVSKDVSKRFHKEVEFHITTNGTLITEEIANFFNVNRFSVFISIDASRKIHDKARRDISGNGTFQNVKNNISLLRSKPQIHLIGSAVVQKGLSLISATKSLKKLGFHQCKIEPVRVPQEHHLNLSSAEHDVYISEIDWVGLEYIRALRKGCKPFDPRLTSRILQLMAKRKRHFFCLASSLLIGISTDGGIYPCALHCGRSGSKLGSIQKGLDLEKAVMFRSRFDIQSRKKCISCWNRYLCGGGCSAMVGKFGTDDCAVIKKESEAAIGVFNYCKDHDHALLYGLISPDLLKWVYS